MDSVSVYQGSLNCDDYDPDYLERTGVGVSCDYYTAGNGRVCYTLVALVDHGDTDANWTVEQFAEYWAERQSYWMSSTGDDISTMTTINVQLRGSTFLAQKCDVVMEDHEVVVV